MSEQPRLSLAQQRVVERMRDGWSLAYFPYSGAAFDAFARLSKPPDSKPVRINTVRSLLRLGVIEQANKPLTSTAPVTYRLVLREAARG